MGLFISLTIFSGCAPTSPTGEKLYLLGTSKVRQNKQINKEELEGLIGEKPNRRFLGLPVYPYLGLYRLGESGYDKANQQRKLNTLRLELQQEMDRIGESDSRKLLKIQRRYGKKIEKANRRVDQGNFIMRVLGEAPVYFNRGTVERNAEKMRRYLFNKGFFEASVAYQLDTLVSRVQVNYKITENRPTLIRRYNHYSTDQRVDSILRANEKFSAIIPGKRYDGGVFEEERIKVETLLRNNGYYGFSRQNITYLINDTISSPDENAFRAVDVTLQVNENQKELAVFKVDSMSFEISAPAKIPIQYQKYDRAQLKGITYSFPYTRYSPKILDNIIQLRPGDYYSQQKERETQRQLSLLDQFQFINYAFDTTGQKLTGQINAIPLDKYQISADFGATLMQLQQTPGPFANLAFKVRNIFNGLENFELSVRGGIEAVTGFSDAQFLYRSQELSINSTLVFPQILAPIGKHWYTLGRYTPRTQVGIGYNSVHRPEYVRTSLKSGLTYSLQPSNFKLYSLSLIDLNVLNTKTIQPEFQDLLLELQQQGNNLINSFRRSFVSSMGFSYIYNTSSYNGAPKDAVYMKGLFESGGTSINLFPGQQEIIRDISGNNELEFFQYLRWNIDLRKYWRLGQETSFVARINSGAVHSYGISSVPPYEKYFFAGGSNSVRAWLPRRLGPGGLPPRVASNDLLIEAPGDFLLEGNLEFRSHLINFLGKINYAIFLDFGNVWYLPNMNYTESGGDFKLNRFYKEIAVGTGLGLRYDFSYFVLRFDFGAKVYDPYTKEFMLDELKFNRLFNRKESNFLNINIGVGYPF